MTRSFSKDTSHSALKLTSLCIAIALGLVVHGAPSLANSTSNATFGVAMVHMSAAC